MLFDGDDDTDDDDDAVADAAAADDDDSHAAADDEDDPPPTCSCSSCLPNPVQVTVIGTDLLKSRPRGLAPKVTSESHGVGGSRIGGCLNGLYKGGHEECRGLLRNKAASGHARKGFESKVSWVFATPRSLRSATLSFREGAAAPSLC